MNATSQTIIKHKGILINNPRDTIREAAKNDLISNPRGWFVHLENRNLTLHVYNEDVADRIYASLPLFKADLDAFIEKIISL